MPRDSQESGPSSAFMELLQADLWVPGQTPKLHRETLSWGEGMGPLYYTTTGGFRDGESASWFFIKPLCLMSMVRLNNHRTKPNSLMSAGFHLPHPSLRKLFRAIKRCVTPPAGTDPPNQCRADTLAQAASLVWLCSLVPAWPTTVSIAHESGAAGWEQSM